MGAFVWINIPYSLRPGYIAAEGAFFLSFDTFKTYMYSV